MVVLKALMGWLAKPSDDNGADQRRRESFTPTSSAGGESLTVLVADMDGPDGAALSARIAEALSRVRGARVERINQSLTLPPGLSVIEGLMAASEKGRDWLDRHNADVLVWGVIEGTGRSVELRFLPLNTAPDTRPGVIGVGDQLSLPARYPAELEDIIIACAIASGGPVRNGQKGAAMALVHEFADRLRLLGDAELATLEPEQRLTILSNIGNVLATDSRGQGGDDALVESLTIYRRAVESIPRETDGARQALLHNHMAVALQAQAASEDNNAYLEQAIDSYRAAIAVLQKSRHAQDWALTHMRLGLAVYRLALKTGRAKMMKHAVEALEQSLTVYTKEKSPGKWAEVMNHIGVVMTALGEELTNNTMLERAVAVFNESLSVRKREMVPSLWAQTTNNLGAAAFSLAKRTSNKALMEQAALAFEGAVEVYHEIGQDRRVHVIEKNLQRVQRRLEVM